MRSLIVVACALALAGCAPDTSEARSNCIEYLTTQLLADHPEADPVEARAVSAETCSQLEADDSGEFIDAWTD